MNLEIREFENAIINFCNASALPMEAKKLVMLDVLQQMKEESDKAVKMELAERSRKEQEEQDRKTIKVDSSGEVVEEDEQGISEQDKLGESAE